MKDNPNKPVRVTFLIETDQEDGFYGQVEGMAVFGEGQSPGHAILNVAQALLVALEAEQLRFLRGVTTETSFVSDPDCKSTKQPKKRARPF